MGELTNIISGNPAIFKSADKSNIKSCKLYFGPIQDENGTPSPSNIKPIQGWQQLKYYKLSNPLPLIPINFSPMELNGGTFNYLGDNTFFLSGAVTSNTTFTFPIEPFTFKKGYTYNKVIIIESFGNGVYNTQSIGIGFKHDSTNKQSLVFSPLNQHVNSWRTAGEWPLDDEEINACSILFREGWSNVKFKFVMTENDVDNKTIPFPAVGKNLIDTNVSVSTDPLELNCICIGKVYQYIRQVWIDGTSYLTNMSIQNNSVSFTTGAASAYGVSYCLKLIPEQTYCISGTATNARTRVMFFDQNKQFISSTTLTDLDNVSFTVPANAYYSQVAFNPSKINCTVNISNIQLELGSEPTTYESPVHTAYGGYVDLPSGKLVINYTKSILDENIIIKDLRDETSAIRFRVAHGNYGPECYSNANMKFSYLSFDNTQGVPWGGYINPISGSGYGTLIMRFPAEYNTEEKIKAYLKDHPLELGYRISPVEYQLTPQQMHALFGENYILSDGNENIEVEYAFTDHLAKRKLILNEPHIETLSSSVCTFNTDMIAPLKECKLNFLPYQSPYSTPSPTNVVPILGWNSIQFQTNRTLIPIVVDNFTSGQLGTSNGVINYLGNDTYEFVGSTTDSGSVLIPIQPITFAANTTYYVRIVKEPDSGIGSEDTSLNIAFKTSASRNIFVFRPNYVGWTNYTCSAYVTPTADYEAASLAIGISEGSTSFKFKFFLGTSSFSSLTTNWSSNYGTIYGGYIDLINGELIQTHITMKLKDIIDSVAITADNDYVFFNYTAWNTYEWEPVYVICEAYPTNPDLVNSTTSLRALPDKTLCQTGHLHTSSERIRIKDNRYTTVEDFKEAMGEYKIILKLLTPITYQLTPQQIKTIKNINNIWSDANGTVDIKYWTH